MQMLKMTNMVDPWRIDLVLYKRWMQSNLRWGIIKFGGRLIRAVPSDPSKYNSFKEIGEAVASARASSKTSAGASTEASPSS